MREVAQAACSGFELLDAGMPIYNGVLNDSQIDSLILFIKSLK